MMGPRLPEQTKPIYERHSWTNGRNLNADGAADAEAAELVLQEGTVFIQGGAVEGLGDKASSCLQLTFKWFSKGEAVCLAVHLMRENKRGNTLVTVEPRRTQCSPAVPSTFGQGRELSNKKFGLDSSDPPILLGPLPACGPTLHPLSRLGHLCSSFLAGLLAPLLLPLTSHPLHAIVHAAADRSLPNQKLIMTSLLLGQSSNSFSGLRGALLALQARSPLHIKVNAPSAFHPLPF